MNFRTMAIAGALALLAQPAGAAVITNLPGGTPNSFAGNFETYNGGVTREYADFTFKGVGQNVWISAPGYNFGANGAWSNTQAMVLNSYSTGTFDFIFDAPVAAVLADFIWNPFSTAPLTLSIYGVGDQLLETVQIGTGTQYGKGFYGFGERSAADIARLQVSGAIFGVRDLSTGMAVSAVPEPATWAMMLVGFFGLGGMLRTARRKGALAPA